MVDYNRHNIYSIFVIFTNAIAFTSLGGAISWASPSMVKLLNPNSPISIDNSQASWVGSFLAIGAIAAALPYTYFFNTVGRKWLITSIATSYLIGWIMLLFSTTVTTLCIGRFLIGMAVGPTYGVIPTYLAEIVGKQVRGTSMVILVISRSVGSLVQYIVGPAVSLQALNLISMIFPTVFFTCTFMLPETPYYLIGANKEKEAESVLMKLRGARSSDDIKEEFMDIKKCLQENPKMGYQDLLKEVSTLKTVKVIAIIAISVFAHQFCGVSAITVYMETIYINMKSPIAPNVAVIVTEIVADITVLITLMIIDKVGRKPLLFFASLTGIIANVLIGLFFFLKSKGIFSDQYGWLGLFGMLLIHIGEAMGLASVPVLVMSEVMSFSLKGWLSGFYQIVQGIYNAVSIKLFQILNDDAAPYYAYWMYATCIFLALSYLMVYMPETKQKSLREIQHMLSNENYEKNDEDHPLNQVTKCKKEIA
ncbi:facilitated trehalose transporter Tret1-like [Arctopsyche grandis]|uniref:facilitated trehalose transporter Tret1-like n=1 Tax=Arctopsyche grandis TaxID=121162 RepID=UPI00406D7D09